jgi:hypothetical protein
MVELCKNGFFARLDHENGYVRVQLVHLEHEVENVLASFVCSLGSLAAVLSGATVQLSDGKGGYLLITPQSDGVHVGFASNHLEREEACVVTRENYSQMITLVATPTRRNR